MSDEPKPRGSIRLPPSGLAEEILGQLARGELAAEPEATAAAEPPAEAPAAGVDRIYTFTDSLQLGEEEEEEREVYETWVEFQLADRPFALPVAQVQEILRLPELTPVPHAPFPVLGVFNLRGRVVPLLDLRARLGLPERPRDEGSRIVLVESESRRIGLLVDAVSRVAQLAQSAIDEATQTGMDGVRGLYREEGREVQLLDLAGILTLPERQDPSPADGESPLGD